MTSDASSRRVFRSPLRVPIRRPSAAFPHRFAGARSRGTHRGRRRVHRHGQEDRRYETSRRDVPRALVSFAPFRSRVAVRAVSFRERFLTFAFRASSPRAGVAPGTDSTRTAVGAHQYSYSKGAFVGAGVEVSYYSTRDDDTRRFYGVDLDDDPDRAPATARHILYGETGIDSSKHPEVEQLISAVQFAAGDGRAGSVKLRGTTWEADLDF